MSTLNGIGTAYRGWRHEPDGTSTATLWLTLLWMPVVPLRRHRLRVLTDFENERFATKGQVVAALAGSATLSDPIQVEGRTPLDWGEVARTFLLQWVGFPLAFVVPLELMTGAIDAWTDAHGKPPKPVLLGAMGVYSLYAIWLLALAVHRSRGAPPKRRDR